MVACLQVNPGILSQPNHSSVNNDITQSIWVVTIIIVSFIFPYFSIYSLLSTQYKTKPEEKSQHAHHSRLDFQ